MVAFPFVARALIVTLEELGHAIPGMLFTNEKVAIYIGSYGDPEKSLNFKIGLLEVSFSYKNLWMRKGFCVAATETLTEDQQLIYKVGGPLLPFLISLLLYFFQPQFESETTQELYSICALIFMIATILGPLFNLILNSEPIETENGQEVYNDDDLIDKFLKHSDIASKYNEAMELYKNKKYKDAIILIDELLEKKALPVSVYRFCIRVNIFVGDFQKAQRFDDIFLEEFQFDTKFYFTSDDYNIRGIIHQKNDSIEKSFEYFDRAIDLDPNNLYALNNKGHFLSFYHRYEEAIAVFDKVIELDKSFPSIYGRRALAKIKTGKADEGYLDIQQALKMKPNSAYNIKILGIYYLDQGESDKALALFLIAKGINPETLDIEELILEAKKMNDDKKD